MFISAKLRGNLSSASLPRNVSGGAALVRTCTSASAATPARCHRRPRGPVSFTSIGLKSFSLPRFSSNTVTCLPHSSFARLFISSRNSDSISFTMECSTCVAAAAGGVGSAGDRQRTSTHYCRGLGSWVEEWLTLGHRP